MSNRTPNWQLPPGVSRGTWDYVSSPAIAQQYDSFIKDNPLVRLDIELLKELVDQQQAKQDEAQVHVLDLGCGTGRLGEVLLPMGVRMTNVDLSKSMLAVLQSKIQSQHIVHNKCICASFVDIAGVMEADSVDLVACLFSSLGMVRGRRYRRESLAGVRTVLRTGGQLFLHVHNRYNRLWSPVQWRWLIQSRVAGWSRGGAEYGDRVYSYRNLPSMFLHIYSARELVADLR
ncbi:MAG TPA: hypothetical protein DDW52_16125, partial [Planctomycetaceae bacterium]|nr:hypothetical protein [Planctomycetaceae bacterium]